MVNLKNEFPNLKMSLTAGDVMSESLRDWIETKYGLDVVNFYAGTEFEPQQQQVEPGVYEPTNPNLTLEILDEDTEVGENGEVSETQMFTISKTSIQNSKSQGPYFSAFLIVKPCHLLVTEVVIYGLFGVLKTVLE